MENEKHNHSNDPSSTQPIDDKGRFARDPNAKGESNAQEEPKPFGDEFSDEELLSLGNEVSDEFSDDELLALGDEASDEFDEEEELNLPKRINFDQEDPTKGFGKINKSVNWNQNFGLIATRFRYNCQRCCACFELWCRGYDVQAAPSAGTMENKYEDDPIFRHEYYLRSEEHDKRRQELFDLFSTPEKVTKEAFDEFNKEYDNSVVYFHPFVGLEDEVSWFRVMNHGKMNEATNEGAVGILEEYAKKGGVGSRYAIVVQWNSGSGHAFNAVYEKEGLVFYDAQTGEKRNRQEMVSLLQRAKKETIGFGRMDDKKIDPSFLSEIVRTNQND